MKLLTKYGNRMTAMKTIALLFGARLLVATIRGDQTVPAETLVAPGPSSNTLMTVKTEASSKEASIQRKDSVIALTVDGQRTNLPIELFVFRHQYGGILTSNRLGFARYEFQVRAKEGQGFVWSCWTPDFPRPHRFQILTTESGKSYACYIREGVHLFYLSASRESNAVWRQFLETREKDFADFEHPDAVPVLRIKLIQDTLGWTNTVGLGPQTWNVTVVSLSDSGGELRITVHGAAPQPQCTFALREGKWELVSTSGK